MNVQEFDVIIMGGGLAGLTAALALQRTNTNVALIEKNSYPHHKVCGEYVSNEILPYLQSLGIDPLALGAYPIATFEISTTQGQKIDTTLPLGGFGISRYTLDNAMYLSIKETTQVIFETIADITINDNSTHIKTQEGSLLSAPLVLGAFGKRSIVDKVLQRPFIAKKSAWLGVKAHYEYDFEDHTVALHNFEGGYCGLSKVETGHINACYLTTYNSFKKEKDIESFQQQVMSQNPHLAHFFKHAQLVFDAPLTISQISFDEKKPVEQGIFMIGDSAGLIHPLCGNGMAMAIHSAKLWTDLYSDWNDQNASKEVLEKRYTQIWNKTFQRRLQTGRYIQRLLLKPTTAKLGLQVAKMVPSIVPHIIKKTHGAVV